MSHRATPLERSFPSPSRPQPTSSLLGWFFSRGCRCWIKGSQQRPDGQIHQIRKVVGVCFTLWRVIACCLLLPTTTTTWSRSDVRISCCCCCCTWRAGGKRSRWGQEQRCIWLTVLVLVLHVLTEGPGMAEALVAVGTVKRFLATVQPLMFRQVMLMLKRLLTVTADEWTLT